MKITAQMMTPARAAFGMYAKVGIRTPSAINTMAPETAIHTWTTILPKFHFFFMYRLFNNAASTAEYSASDVRTITA